MITALSFGELARRYPEAGFRSAYHFADRFFARQKNPRYKFIARLGKFATGWPAHLYYWIYPGVLVAFMGILADYLFRYFGYQPTVFGEVILAVSSSAFVGFLAIAWDHRHHNYQCDIKYDSVDHAVCFRCSCDRFSINQPRLFFYL